MKLVTFQRRRGSNRGGILVNNTRVLDLGLAYSKKFGDTYSPQDTQGIVDVLRGLSSSILEILQMGDDSLRSCFELEKLALAGELEDCLYSIGETTLIAPIPVPPLVLEFNVFKGHATAVHRLLSGGDGSLPDFWAEAPAYCLANPYSVLASGDKIVFPEGEEELDFEFQLGAVIGESISGVGVEEAEDAILGYTLVNTWVARGLQRRNLALGLGSGAGRSFATSIGPFIVTKDEIPKPAELDLTASVNGEVVSDGSFGEATFTFPEMISYASQGNVLPAGTIFCSGGTTNCSGLERGVFLKPGDKVELHADVLGSLINEVHTRRHPAVFKGR